LRLKNDSWRTDETYIKIKGVWKYLYRAVDSAGNTLDLRHERQTRWQSSSTLLSQSTQGSAYRVSPNHHKDKNAAYPVAIDALKTDETIDQETELRQSKYLNNIIEQDHRNIKRIVKLMMELKTFNRARRTLSRIEAMNMMRKGQVKGVQQGKSMSGVKFIEAIFGIAA
jgi:transposase-like protein